MVSPMKKPSLGTQIGIALVGGVICGVLFKDQLPTPVLGEIGKSLIGFIKAVAIPMLFFAVVASLIQTQSTAKLGARMIGVASLNASIALALGLVISNWLKPGQSFHELGILSENKTPFKVPEVGFASFIQTILPQNWLQSFLDGNILSIIVIALLIGITLRNLKNDNHEIPWEAPIQFGFKVFERILQFAVRLSPIAVFASVAKTVAEYGFAPIHGLAMYLFAALLGLAIHVLITYQAWIVFYLKMPLRLFWKEIKEPALYSIGTNSSLATLPLTLQSLDRMKCHPSASRMGACIGTNLNNDGVLLYESMAALFVAQSMGIHLPLSSQIVVCLTAMFASMGIAGVPEAGVVALSIVLHAVGLPVEIIPILLTVDWIVARARSVVNVLSDALVSLILSRGLKN